MSVWHWNCDCGAFGSSTLPAANEFVIARHRTEGHVVEIWERGKRHLATTGGSYAMLPASSRPVPEGEGTQK